MVASVPAGLSPANLAVNTVTNKIYVPNQSSQTVSVIDGATNQPKVLITRPNPETAVVNSTTNKIYVGHSDGYVTVIDGATNAFTSIQTGGHSANLVLDEATNRIYVPGGRGIIVIDGSTNSLSTISVSIYAQRLVINPSASKIYFTSGIQDFAVLDLATSRTTVIDVSSPGGGTTWIDDFKLNRATNEVYVAHSPQSWTAAGSISIIDGATDTATTIPVNAYPKRIAVNETTNQVFVAHFPGTVGLTRIDGRTRVATSFPLVATITHMAVNDATNKIYISGHNGYLAALDATSMTSGQIRKDQNNPNAIAINKKTNKIYVSNYETVNVIDGTYVPPSFTSGQPPIKGQVGSFYEYQFAAKGSLTPKFRVSGGTLPPGLALNEAGLLSGIPTTAGSFYFKVAASNGANPEAVTPTLSVTVKNRDIRHDYTGDGRTDVLARDGSGGLWLYPGNGYGGWLPRVQVGQGWNVMSAIIAPGDFNGDGKADLLASDKGGTLWLYPGNGSGGWLPGVPVGYGWNTMDRVVGAGDFTLDGNPDVIARTIWGGMIIFPGNGKGGWLPQQSPGSMWYGLNTLTAPGDFNKDGFQDLLFTDSAGTLYLHPGYKNSGFQDWNSAAVGYGWNAMTAIVGPGDFNGDGNVDLLARDAGGALWLYPSNGKGGWLPRGLVGSGWNAMNLII
ncbi:FG-GAP-like repeat-containing protein [Arthrobacter sp. EpRS71]|uniref:FG-GAP-like repeat-containing protein n=1 Tax=Arthrobacter sp. EpRS71 TaxID=1743141 RepID=UPI0018D2447C|nr:FG-GAP-like repeat-containing protein [Arthrobacter sp. EpRS71]